LSGTSLAKKFRFTHSTTDYKEILNDTEVDTVFITTRHNTHAALVIEALQAAEHMQRIADDPLLTSKDIRNMDLKLKRRGIGCVEAARGTLIHHYETDDRGIITKVNLIVATQHNAAPISLSVKKAAQAFVKGPEVKEGLLNMVEMSFRSYDPCYAAPRTRSPAKCRWKLSCTTKIGMLYTDSRAKNFVDLFFELVEKIKSLLSLDSARDLRLLDSPSTSSGSL
jgi:hypothetical protein